MKYLVLGFFWGILQPAVFAQVELQIACADCPFLPQKKISRYYSDSAAAFFAADSLHRAVQQQGYLACSIDSLYRRNEEGKAPKISFQLIFQAGNLYKGVLLKNKSIDTVILQSIGYQDFLYRENEYFSLKKLSVLKEKLVRWGETHGYPFCTVYLENVAVDYPNKGDISAVLAWRKGKFFTFDSLEIDGKVRLTNRFLAQYLGVKRGAMYDEAKIGRVRMRLAELPFVEETQPTITEFSERKARLHLFLKRKRASQFDLLLGFLPNPKKASELLVTGNADLGFQNLFGNGEQFSLHWQQARPESPEGRVSFNIPYLFRLPVGATSLFELYKRDTSYLETRTEIGAQYRLEGNDAFRVFWNNSTTTLLNIDTVAIKQIKQLPSILDMQTNAFGIAYTQERLDYRFNPQHGYSYAIKASGGLKTIRENGQISNLYDKNSPDFSFKRLFDTVARESYQYRVSLQAAYYFPIGTRSCLKTGLDAAYIGATAPLLRNEQYRIGGARRLRGFNEESLFASFYAIATLEYRFIIGQNSYLFAFADQAYLEDKSTYTNFSDRPLGIGVGMSFETKAGIFALTVAFGKEGQQQVIDFNAAKVHFGYINLF